MTLSAKPTSTFKIMYKIYNFFKREKFTLFNTIPEYGFDSNLLKFVDSNFSTPFHAGSQFEAKYQMTLLTVKLQKPTCVKVNKQTYKSIGSLNCLSKMLEREYSAYTKNNCVSCTGKVQNNH